MKRKNFKKYIEKRLTKSEITKIERQAKLEKNALKNLQQDITSLLSNYMKKEKIGFNELVRRLNVSPSHIAKIQRGEANLTLSSLARISSVLNFSPNLTFSDK
ncbi:MAG: helix-turn-helix transcriptional regulator [bacterium]